MYACITHSRTLSLYFQYSELSTLYRIILIAVLVVMTIIELIRLYLGYVGNLSEQVTSRYHGYQSFDGRVAGIYVKLTSGLRVCVCPHFDHPSPLRP